MGESQVPRKEQGAGGEDPWGRTPSRHQIESLERSLIPGAAYLTLCITFDHSSVLASLSPFYR